MEEQTNTETAKLLFIRHFSDSDRKSSGPVALLRTEGSNNMRFALRHHIFRNIKHILTDVFDMLNPLKVILLHIEPSAVDVLLIILSLVGNVKF